MFNEKERRRKKKNGRRNDDGFIFYETGIVMKNTK